MKYWNRACSQIIASLLELYLYFSFFIYIKHASLQKSLREKLTAKGTFNGFFLIMILNFWNVKWLNSTIAAFLEKIEYFMEKDC